MNRYLEMLEDLLASSHTVSEDKTTRVGTTMKHRSIREPILKTHAGPE